MGVRKGFDLFGIATLGVLTGIGGGVLRDVLLDIMPPTSVQHWPNITIALVAVAIATPLARLVMQMQTAVLVLDAIGMGVLATSSAAIAVGSTVATALRLAGLPFTGDCQRARAG